MSEFIKLRYFFIGFLVVYVYNEENKIFQLNSFFDMGKVDLWVSLHYIILFLVVGMIVNIIGYLLDSVIDVIAYFFRKCIIVIKRKYKFNFIKTQIKLKEMQYGLLEQSEYDKQFQKEFEHKNSLRDIIIVGTYFLCLNINWFFIGVLFIMLSIYCFYTRTIFYKVTKTLDDKQKEYIKNKYDRKIQDLEEENKKLKETNAFINNISCCSENTENKKR